MKVNEKLAYLKGLFEGSDLTLGAKEKKIVDALFGLLEEMAESITALDEDVENLYDGFEAVCDSLDEIEDDLDELLEGEEGDDSDDMLYDVECPKCKEVICIDEDTLLEGDISCPNCGEKLEFDLDCDCGCEDEDCDCHK